MAGDAYRPRQLLLNAFEMASPGHIAHGLWTHPRDRASSYIDLDYWIGLAQTLERGKFDGLFLADVVGIYDVYRGGPEAALRYAVQVPNIDPTLLVPAMAAATRHLGFGVTVNLTCEQPYLFARRMSTLDHLTRGRIAWNIVTGFLDSTARSIGLDTQPDHDARYDQADEFMDVVYDLWETSWDDDAVRRDAGRRVYTDPGKVRPVRHQGARFRLHAIHLAEPSPQRTPLLFQAGASARGLDFAVRHGECLFVPNQGKAATAALIAGLRRQLAAAGRDALIFTSILVIVGRTDREAEEKRLELERHAIPEAGLAQLASATGIDFSGYAPDEQIRATKSDGIQSAAQAVTRDGTTVRGLLASMPLGGRAATIVGGPARVASELAAWAEEADIDGFNLVRTLVPDCFTDFVDLVIPELQARGLFKRDYADGTLRDKLFGHAYLPASHPGRARRALQE